MELPTATGVLVGEGRGYATVISPGLAGEVPAEPPLVVVGPHRSYAGVVVDENDVGLAGVELLIHLDDSLAGRLVPGGLAGMVPVAQTRSGEDGEFALETVGFAERSSLTAELDGYELRSRGLPPDSAPDMVIRLRRVPETEDAIAGVVLTPEGDPVPDAMVSAGGLASRTDSEGSFFITPRTEDGELVRAVAPGMLPAVRSLAGVDVDERRNLVLYLGRGGPHARGHGRRRGGTSGSPCAGVDLRRRAPGVRRAGVRGDEVPGGQGRRGGDRRRPPTGAGLSPARTEASSSRGLLDRAYEVFAMHPETLAITRAESVPAGRRGIRLVLEGGEPTARVAGRVVRTSGEAVEGVQVQAGRKVPTSAGASPHRSAGHDFHVTSRRGRPLRVPDLAVTERGWSCPGRERPLRRCWSSTSRATWRTWSSWSRPRATSASSWRATRTSRSRSSSWTGTENASP